MPTRVREARKTPRRDRDYGSRSFSVTSPLTIVPRSHSSSACRAHWTINAKRCSIAPATNRGGASRGLARPSPYRRRQDTELTAKLHVPAFSTQVEDTIEWSGEIGHVSLC